MWMDFNPAIPHRLDLLDGYLERTESRAEELRPCCEKTIIWNDGEVRQREIAIVYLHGFSASRMETSPLCDRLARSMGANLFYTRLTGHGQDGPAMACATAEDWLNDGIEAVSIGRRLGKKIILVGTSTGATLATWLAAQPALVPRIHSLILLSPNYFPKNPLAAAALWPPSFRLFDRFFGEWRNFTITNVRHARYWTIRYPLTAVATMMQLVRQSWRVDLANASMPVLMMVNPWDRVINVSLALFRFRRFPGPQNKLVLFRGNTDIGRHVLAGDILAPEATPKALALIQDFLDCIVKDDKGMIN